MVGAYQTEDTAVFTKEDDTKYVGDDGSVVYDLSVNQLRELFSGDAGEFYVFKYPINGRYLVRLWEDDSAEITHLQTDLAGRGTTVDNAIRAISKSLRYHFGAIGHLLPRACGEPHMLPCGISRHCPETESIPDEYTATRNAGPDVFNYTPVDSITEFDDHTNVDGRLYFSDIDDGSFEDIKQEHLDWREHGRDVEDVPASSISLSVQTYDNPHRRRQMASWGEIKESLDEYGGEEQVSVLVNTIWFTSSLIDTTVTDAQNVLEKYAADTEGPPETELDFETVFSYWYADIIPYLLQATYVRKRLVESLDSEFDVSTIADVESTLEAGKVERVLAMLS